MRAPPILTLSMRAAVGTLPMRHTRARHVDDPLRAAALRIAGRDEDASRPAWPILAWTLGIAMALWAMGILEVPDTSRRLVDWIGGLTVLGVLVGWVRANARSLAAEQPADRDDRVGLRVRLIRSRRPPLDSIGGPDLERRRRWTHRIPSS
jgi:hypothetical protein